MKNTRDGDADLHLNVLPAAPFARTGDVREFLRGPGQDLFEALSAMMLCADDEQTARDIKHGGWQILDDLQRLTRVAAANEPDSHAILADNMGTTVNESLFIAASLGEALTKNEARGGEIRSVAGISWLVRQLAQDAQGRPAE
jgi:hypothetical protein